MGIRHGGSGAGEPGLIRTVGTAFRAPNLRNRAGLSCPPAFATRRARSSRGTGLPGGRLAAAAAAGTGPGHPTAPAPESNGEPARPAARSGPATAKWEAVDVLRAGAAAARHPADGGGRARLLHE